MEANKLNVGDEYYYVSVPNDCNWMEIEVKGPCIHKEKENLEQYIYSQNSKELNDILPILKNRIIKKFEQLNDGWEATPYIKQYWVTLNYASHLKTIHCKGSEAPTNTPCNYFESEEKAEEMKQVIIDTFALFNKPLQ